MNTFNTFGIAVLTLAIAGCGGSPSSTSTPTPAPKLSLSSLQGIWRSPAGAASTLSAIVLPDGKLWALISNASSTRVLKGAFDVETGSFVASGKSFSLGTTTSSAMSASASVVERSSMNGSIATAGLTEPYSLAYQARYDTAAALTDFSGVWSETLGPGTVNWTISSTGAISGTRTTGCTYVGQLSLRAELKAVVNAVVTETCAAAVTQLSGIAVKSEDNLGINMLLTNTDESAAVAINLAH